MLKESDQIRLNVGTPNARWKVAPDAQKTRRERDEEKVHIHWGIRKRSSKDGVGTRRNGVVENENVQPGQGCTLIFQAATKQVAVSYFLTTQREGPCVLRQKIM